MRMSDRRTDSGNTDSADELARRALGLALAPGDDADDAIATLHELSAGSATLLLEAVTVLRGQVLDPATRAAACRLLSRAASRCPCRSTPLLLERYVVDGSAMVTLVGELDADSEPKLRALLDDLLDGGHVTITVDLGCLGFISASGLRPLVAAANRCRAEGGRLTLTNPGPMTARILDICGIPVQ
jgi:anti-anti-sigma factor